MEVTNYKASNFIIQCTNKQHSPPFITWNRIFKTQLNVGRDFSKAKPDVVQGVYCKPNWGIYSSGEVLCWESVWCGERSRGRAGHYHDVAAWREAELYGHTSHRVRLSAAMLEVWSGRMSVGGGGMWGGGTGVRLVRQQGALLCCQTQVKHKSPFISSRFSPVSQTIRLGRKWKWHHMLFWTTSALSFEDCFFFNHMNKTLTFSFSLHESYQMLILFMKSKSTMPNNGIHGVLECTFCNK